MAQSVQVSHAASAQPEIRKIGLSDIAHALMEGVDDFRAKPTHLYYLAFIYPIVTFGAFLVVFNYNLLPLVFPVISGSLLVGPFLTISLCEISRKRELGMDIASGNSGNFLHNPAASDIIALGAMLMALFLIWLGVAMTIYGLTLGDPWNNIMPASVQDFVTRLLTTPNGWALIVIGNIVGLLFAVTALCVGAISFPMLLDRNVGVSTAIKTSVRAALANPIMVLIWGLIVGVSLLVGAIPFLVGLALIVPILGHATWHFYRKLIV